MSEPFRTSLARRISALRPRKAVLLLLAGALLPALPGTAQIVPDAPIENFRLPMFGDAGFRIWDLRGDEARFVSESHVDVLGMRLRVFSGEPDERVRTLIRSPEAQVYLERNQARGERSIRVDGDHYHATGRIWTWERDENRIVIREDVEVTFYEELEGFLMPLP